MSKTNRRPRWKKNLSNGLGFALATMVFASSFVGCPLLKKKPPPEDDDTSLVVGDAATVSVSGTGAKNEANVLRYANETPLAAVPAIIGTSGTKARNFPGNGPEVATLAKGTIVAKMSQYFSTGVLIMFDDPSGDGSKLLGWVSPKAFDISAPAPTKTIVVPPQPTFKPVVVDAGGGNNNSVVPGRDAGVLPPTDAGIAVRDAGAPVVDAGGGTTPPTPTVSKGTIAVPPDGAGKCPVDFVISEKICRRKCASDGDCPRGIKCQSKPGGKVCSSG